MHVVYLSLIGTHWMSFSRKLKFTSVSLWLVWHNCQTVSFFGNIRTFDLVNNARLRYYADRWSRKKLGSIVREKNNQKAPRFAAVSDEPRFDPDTITPSPPAPTLPHPRGNSFSNTDSTCALIRPRQLYPFLLFSTKPLRTESSFDHLDTFALLTFNRRQHCVFS